jgi:hypothetical protein
MERAHVHPEPDGMMMWHACGIRLHQASGSLKNTHLTMPERGAGVSALLVALSCSRSDRQEERANASAIVELLERVLKQRSAAECGVLAKNRPGQLQLSPLAT